MHLSEKVHHHALSGIYKEKIISARCLPTCREMYILILHIFI